MQGLGILAAAAVTLLVTSIFKSAYPGTPYGHSEELIRGSCPPEADFVWRIVLSFGCVPALLTTYLRSKMPESPRYTLQVKGNAAKAARDTGRAMSGAASAAAAPLHPPPPPPPAISTRAFLAAWWRPLLGCSASWFLLDIACALAPTHAGTCIR
jgi:PHS family inorganic phosphate transporter-like MFS transporter